MPISHDRSPARKAAWRRGMAVYLFVVVIGTMLAMTGLTLVAVERSNRRLHTSVLQSLQAQYVAHAGIERALAYMDADPSWRQNMPNGVWSSRTFGAGSYILAGTDTDGSLSNEDSDQLTLTSTATVSDAVYKVQVTVGPRPYAALGYACFAQSWLYFHNNASVWGPIRAHNNILSTSSTIARQNVFFETLLGYTIDSDLSPTRYATSSLPYPQPSLSYYVGLATPISGIAGGTAKLSRYVLTPTRNSESPGQVNANGIYALNATGRSVVIEKSHIKGTLIIYNTQGNQVTIQHACWIEPAGPLYPTMLIFTNGGDVNMNLDASALSESGENTDFNEDGDKVDSFPTLVQGVVWTQSSYVAFHENSASFVGCLMGNTIEVYNGATVNDDPTLAQQRMPGFVDPDMKIVAGSWKEMQP